ncbi:hypothetical protein [Streptomyces sp. CBMA123]|uniref:hypothetical protein n=1 Tax=Streptomyces sp. CBMA123 TaxID=1896313 RepID=UPI001661A3D0|nr:hypothetical protein [Streptomyces sp. CBMA123]MBD0693261.1 hypothetical protein [Streptomyces sp. CBMA123]
MSFLRDQDTCLLLGKAREEPPTVFEYLAAELWVRHHFGVDFDARPGATWVTFQLDRISEWWGTPRRDRLGPEEALPYGRLTAQPQDPVLRMVLQVLSEDLHNTFPTAKVDAIKRMLKDRSTPAVKLVKAVRELTPGGALKPDLLGLQNHVPELRMEALEVGTEGGALDTHRELQGKIAVLRDPCGRMIENRLIVMQRTAVQQLPYTVVATGTDWRLGAGLKILPMPVNVTEQNGETYVDWICYWPTDRAEFRDHPRPADGRPGYDGLVLYHIHRVPLRAVQLPDRIREAMLNLIRARQRPGPLGPTLVPELALTIDRDRRLFTPEGELFLAGLGAAGLLALGVWAAVGTGVVAGLGVVAKGGLAAAASAPELFVGAVAAAARLADQLWPVISQLGYALPAPG